jgi:hypothetical protein
MGTAKIVHFFDKLFDSVNGGTLHPRCGKPLSGGVYKNSGHTKFWQEAVQHLRNMYFIDNFGKKTVPPSLKNWIKTLEGFLDLYKILVEGGKCKFFLPRALNQDVIENYFGKVRNQRSRAVNPTAIQFRETFKSLMIRNFCGTKSIGTNCEKTNIPDLFNIRGLVDKMNSNDYQNSELSYEIFNVNKYISNLSELEKKLHQSIIGYVSGWITKTLKHLNCQDCKSQIISNYSENEQCYKLTNEREYNAESRKLKYCTLEFIKNINKIYNISKIILSNITSAENIKSKISTVIQHHVKFSFTCEHKNKIEDEIIGKIINITIFTYIKGLNLILSGKDTRKIDFRNNIYKNAAELYKKRLKIKNRKYC